MDEKDGKERDMPLQEKDRINSQQRTWTATDFLPPKSRGRTTRFLYVANCGPSVGVTLEQVQQVFGTYGKIEQIVDGEETAGRGALVYVIFTREEDAKRARDALHGRPLPIPGGRKIAVQYADANESSTSKQITCRAETDPEKLSLPGLMLYADFVTEKEEEALLREIDSAKWDKLAKRRIQHYGCVFDYSSREVDVQKPVESLPPWTKEILQKASILDVAMTDFDQLTINEYMKGVGLSPHVDTHASFGDTIMSLTLGGHTVMEFRRDERQKCLFLPRRSLLVMTGECRYGWKHYIPHRKYDRVGETMIPRPGRRVSLTFRQVRKRNCRCDFPEQCNDRAKSRKVPSIELNYVQTMYNNIAPHFSSTRFAIWPEVRRFLDSLVTGSLVADVGCGNGKYLGLRKDLVMLGSDNSEELLKICSARGFDVAVADGVHLPYRSGCLDALISIAVLHHISTQERRKAMITEFLRVVRPGGKIFLTVWALEQENPEKTIQKWHPIPSQSQSKGKDYFVPWHLPLHRPETAAAIQQVRDLSQQAEQHGEIIKEKNTVMFKRFYHVFEQNELSELVASVPGAVVLEVFYDKSNWCISFMKRP